MGYRTCHTITCQNENGSTSLSNEMIAFLTETSGYGESDFDGTDDVKWYDCDDDMILLSERFPNITFRIEGHGENFGDIWVKWFRDASCIGHWWAPDILIPEGFDPPVELL